MGLDELIYILLAVVVGKLLTGHDGTHDFDIHARAGLD
jgi:hypothetical protein